MLPGTNFNFKSWYPFGSIWKTPASRHVIGSDLGSAFRYRHAGTTKHQIGAFCGVFLASVGLQTEEENTVFHTCQNFSDVSSLFPILNIITPHL